MTIEMVIGRGMRLWINGTVIRDFSFEWDDDEMILELTGAGALTEVTFDVSQRDWINTARDGRQGPTRALVTVEGIAHAATVEETWWPREDDLGSPKGVRTESGDWAEVNETEVYLRLTLTEDRA